MRVSFCMPILFASNTQMQINALWRKVQLPFRTLPVLRVTLLDLKNLSASPMAGLQRLAEVIA